MKWTKDRSIVLSQVCLVIFAVLLLAIDLLAYKLAQLIWEERLGQVSLGVLFMVSIYVGSVFAWLCLWQLWRLLDNIRRERVFTAENVRCMRRISWCCVGAAAVSFLSAAYYPLIFLALAISAGFMALIVRIVKNIFQQAIEMKSELDFTV